MVAGLVLLALAALTWTPAGVELLSVIIGLFGLVYLLRAFQGWRKNR